MFYLLTNTVNLIFISSSTVLCLTPTKSILCDTLHEVFRELVCASIFSGILRNHLVQNLSDERQSHLSRHLLYHYHFSASGTLLYILIYLVPPRLHCKNPIDPRHVTIRSIFLHLKIAEPEVSDATNAVRAIRISNDLYGSDTLSAYEMAKGFSKPLLADQRPLPVDKSLPLAHEELIAKVILTLRMRSNTYTNY